MLLNFAQTTPRQYVNRYTDISINTNKINVNLGKLILIHIHVIVVVFFLKLYM